MTFMAALIDFIIAKPYNLSMFILLLHRCGHCEPRWTSHSGHWLYSLGNWGLHHQRDWWRIRRLSARDSTRTGWRTIQSEQSCCGGWLSILNCMLLWLSKFLLLYLFEPPLSDPSTSMMIILLCCSHGWRTRSDVRYSFLVVSDQNWFCLRVSCALALCISSTST